MPAGDRRGPAGMGPMSGRAAGYCAGYDMPGYANPVMGRGRLGGCGFGGRWGGGRDAGYGRGRGMGWGWRTAEYRVPVAGDPYRYPDPEDEIKLLLEESRHLEAELKQMKQRIEELKKSESGETSES